MSIDLQSLLGRFRVFKDLDNDIAFYRTLVPWVGPEAYLNIIYRAAPAQLLSAAAAKLRFPVPVFEFLSQYNGAKLFSGALNLHGVVEPGRLLNRSDSFSLPPYNIEGANRSWSVDPQRLLVIGVYQFDGSQVCIDRSSGRIFLFKKKPTTAGASWTNFESWFREEISRLCSLFDRDGRRLCPESATIPHGTTDREEQR
jgi:hypothetical protein